MDNPRREGIQHFLKNPTLPARLGTWSRHIEGTDYDIFLSLKICAPDPEANHRVSWEYLGELGSHTIPGVRLPPDKWKAEMRLFILGIMAEDLAGTPFKIPENPVERPGKGIALIGNIAPMELIRSIL